MVDSDYPDRVLILKTPFLNEDTPEMEIDFEERLQPLGDIESPFLQAELNAHETGDEYIQYSSLEHELDDIEDELEDEADIPVEEEFDDLIYETLTPSVSGTMASGEIDTQEQNVEEEEAVDEYLTEEDSEEAYEEEFNLSTEETDEIDIDSEWELNEPIETPYEEMGWKAKEEENQLLGQWFEVSKDQKNTIENVFSDEAMVGYTIEPFESQLSIQSTCKPYPTQFKLFQWPKRWQQVRSANRERFFNYLRVKKNLKLAILARGIVRVKTERVNEILKPLLDQTTLDFDTLEKVFPKTNVAIEIIRELVAPSHTQELVRQHIEYYHEKYLKECFFTDAVYSNLGTGKFDKQWMEDTFDVKLDRAFRVTGLDKLQKPETNKIILVAYLSFPAELLDHLRFVAKVDPKSLPSKTFPNLINKDLKAVRHAASFIYYSPKYVDTFIKKVKYLPGHWVRRIPDYARFIRSLDKIMLNVELFKMEGSDIKDLDIIRHTTREFDNYLQAKGAAPYISYLYPIDHKAVLEEQLHIDLTGLVKKKPASASKKDKFYFLIYISFPKSVRDSGLIISDKDEILDGFRFNSATLTKNHKKRLWYLALHIVDSWRGYQYISWKDYKPVSEVQTLGAADSIGSEKYNKRLGLLRAKAVEKVLKYYINKIWNKDPLGRGAKPLTSRITFSPPDSIGKGGAVSSGQLGRNPKWRAVSIKMFYHEKGSERLQSLLEELLNSLENDPDTVKKIMRDDEAKVVKCIVKKLEKDDVDDRIALFPHGQYDRTKLEPRDFMGARFMLLRKNIFNEEQSIEGKLKNALDIHRTIKKNNSEMERVAAKDGVATDNKIKMLLEWTKFQIHHNPKSIYECYK